YRLRRRDGEFRWVLDRGLPRYSADRVFVGFVGTCIDIDERKRAEHELARSLERERKLRIATEASSRARDAFLASVLAELQSPVRAVARRDRAQRARAGPDHLQPARALARRRGPAGARARIERRGAPYRRAGAHRRRR